VLWLAVDRGLGYHRSVLFATAIYLCSGLAALSIVLRGLGGSPRALATAVVCGVVFFGVLGQTAWMLRPFFGRPAQHAIPFVRAREGSFADALAHTRRSAMGIYDHKWSRDAENPDSELDPEPIEDAAGASPRGVGADCPREASP
jgi:hypothetical protein